MELEQISLIPQLMTFHICALRVCGCYYFLLLAISCDEAYNSHECLCTVTTYSDFMCEREAASGMGMLRGCGNPPVAIIEIDVTVYMQEG